MGVLGSATMALSLVGVERKRTAAADRIRQRRERVAAKNAAHGGQGTPAAAAAAGASAGAAGAAATSAGSGAEIATPTHDGGDADSPDRTSAAAPDTQVQAASETASADSAAAGADGAAPDAVEADNAGYAAAGEDTAAPTIAEKKVFGTEDSERDITDEFPVITEQMLSEAEAADGWTDGADDVETGAETAEGSDDEPGEGERLD